MKRVALVVVVAGACGHKAPPAGGEHDLDVARTAGAAAAIDAGAPVTPVAAPIPALADDGPHAFVADDHGLVEVARSGKAQTIVAAKPTWCAADARAQVVWFAGDDGLYAFDLADRRVRRIVAGAIESDVTIDWGTERLGGENKLDYQVALGVRMTTPPRVSSELGCDGDQADYCYDDDGKTLRPEIVDKQQRLDAMTIADPAYVATLVARGHDRSLWTPPPVPPAAPAKKPKVARKACEEEPQRCGLLVAMPATPLWLVVTANSRGDFYHETRELWDPSTSEFIAITGGALVRATHPQGGDQDYRDLRIAPDGGLSIDGVVFDPTHVVYAPSGDVPITCGWSTGGWRIPAPTE